jgi:DNA-binding response OmpR family regulator
MGAEFSLLIVEDDDELRLSLRDYLSSHGYSVVVAADGISAVRLLTDQDFDLIITDFRLNQFGGGEFLRFLQKFCPQTLVLVISGYLESSSVLPYPYVAKPFDYGDIEEKIRGLLRHDRPDSV